MKKTYLIPEVELVEIQKVNVIAASMPIVDGEADENGDDEKANDQVFDLDIFD